ncbi:MAG: PhoU domain-containing protein [Streptosporangiaceae bacterium]
MRDLEAIEARIIELFAIVAEDLPEATNALLTGSNDIMQRLTDRDKTISALYPQTEALANREILLQAPVADDLRFLLSVLRVLTEFELSHDLVIQIASRGNHFLSDDLSPRTRGIVERMGILAADMWRQVLVLVLALDEVLVVAELPPDAEDELDEEHAARPIAMTASPAVVTCRLRRRCIFGYSLTGFIGSWAAKGSPVILQTVVCEYSLAAAPVPAGKCEMAKKRLKA